MGDYFIWEGILYFEYDTLFRNFNWKKKTKKNTSLIWYQLPTITEIILPGYDNLKELNKKHAKCS